MISMKEFHQEFAQRHDFQYDDMSFLSDKFKTILFNNIPQAWVCCIYDCLSLIDISKIISISQIMGFPIIQYENNIGDFEFDILKKMERDLYLIDKDLHNSLDAAIILN